MLGQLSQLHYEIFQSQIKFLNQNIDYLSNNVRKNKAYKSQILDKRATSSSSTNSYVNSFEQILLLTLDSNKQVSNNIQLNLFYLLLNRAEKVEEKLLCIHVLRYHTPRNSHIQLVKSGLFNIIKKWILQCLAQDYESNEMSGIPVLTIICHLLRECYYLDIDVAKKYDILKLIKKISKVSSTLNNTEELQKAVADLKSSWQEEVNKEDSAVRAALIKSKLKNDKVDQQTNQSETPAGSDTTPLEREAKTSELQINVEKALDETNSASSSTSPSAIPPPHSPSSSSAPSSASASTSTSTSAPSSVPTTTSLLNALSASAASAAAAAASGGTKIPVVPARTSHQPLNVVGKLGANQIQDLIQMSAPPRQPKSLSKSLSEKNIGLTREESTFEILQQAMLPKIVLVKSSEVKGIMKKNKIDDNPVTVVEEKPKNSGRLITWNEKLFDIRYFEVEASNNMTKSTSRLRQEVHQKKIMTTSCEWKKPDKREVLLEDKVEVHSFEESIQRKRLLSILQRFYPDDDDIPSDPEDDPSVEEKAAKKIFNDCPFIPWDNDEVPGISVEESVPAPSSPYIEPFDQSDYMAEEKEAYPFRHRLLNTSTSYGSSENSPQHSTNLLHSPTSSAAPATSSNSFSSSPSSSSHFSQYSSNESYSTRPDMLCHFYNQRQGCRRGLACPYIHENLEKKRISEPYEYPPPPKKTRSSRSPSPPQRFGRTRSPSPPLQRGRTVSRDSNYYPPIPLRQTREQMKLTSTIYGADRAPSPPSPPALKNPTAYRKLASTVCSAYISGTCRYGYKCHYLHEQMDMFGDIEDEEEDNIPIPKVSPNTWNKTIDRDNTVLVKMKGLPSNVSYADILQFFTVFDIRREAIKIVLKDGRITGEAYVKFRAPTVAVDAIRALNMKRMGKRFVELFQADYYDADRISIL